MSINRGMDEEDVVHKCSEILHSWGGRRWTHLREEHWNIYITIYKIDSQWEFAVWHRNPKLVLCVNLEGWDGREVGGMFKNKGTYVYLWLIHVDIWHKSTQHCKIVILKLKTKWKKNFKLFKWNQRMRNVSVVGN